MSMNNFITTPPRVVVYDPVANKNRRTFIFLGDVSKNIINACQYYHTVKPGQKAAYDKLLREFYGSDYKSKLGLDIKDWESAFLQKPEVIQVIEGGNSNNVDFNNVESIIDPIKEYEDSYIKSLPEVSSDVNEVTADYNVYTDAPDEQPEQNLYTKYIEHSLSDTLIDDYDVDEIEQLLAEPIKTKEKGSARRTIEGVLAEDLRITFNPGVEYITDVHIYPEDKFSELKDKIHLTTGIPAYRQHLFHVNRGRILYPYILRIEGGIYIVDIRLINYKDTVLGIPVDKYAYDAREEVKVEAADNFRTLGTHLWMDNTIYIVDLAQFTYPIQTQLIDVVNDTYQFELFYYGFIIKYWPQLMQECFYDYVINEAELQHKYPELAKNKSILQQTYRMEREIVDYNYKHLPRALAYANNNGVSIAITQMIATVISGGILLNIRNIFDKLRVTRCIPEIHAYIEHNNKRYMLRKRHIKNASDIQFPSGSLMKTGITIAISLRKADQESFHSRSSISTMENEQSRYLFLNIWPNGRYYIRTIWNEEDELQFDEIVRIMKRFTDPLINGINNLGRYAFIQGGSLPLITKQNIIYQSLNICVFWKRVMLENTFKIIRALWEPYMRARITGPRNVQQFDKYEFIFRKGMHEFDTTLIDRVVTASNNVVLNNYYSYLSNNAVKQKWDQNYDGRIVRMSHRTTDIRFEVSDIRDKEFETFYSYIVCFIYRSINDEKIKSALNATRNYKDIKKLRKLREQDPELFNLKKYGSKTVYSKLCQGPRQPLIYTQDELKNMSAADVKKLTEYWNFTLNKPAYYGCPDRKYPHLSFIVGTHPKHYCLPCCNKKSHMVEEGKKTKVVSICLQKHKFILGESATDIGVSRHVMNYGKDVDVGRLSKLPQSSIKNLLFGTLTDPNLNYYIYGVPQHIPGIENCGLVYAAAECLGMSMEELVKKLLYELKKSQGIFNTLLNGVLLEYFHSIDDLIVSIKDLFMDKKMFSKEYQKFKQWSELFTELLYVLFKVSIFTFIDEDGHGATVDLFIPDVLKNEMLYTSRLLAEENSIDRETLAGSIMTGQTYIILIKKRNRYYPIFIINPDHYFKTLDIDTKKYAYEHRIIQLIYSMLKYETKNDDIQLDKPMDLSLIREFSISSSYVLKLKLINKQNLCYAVLLEIAGDFIYVPVDYSVYISDGVSVSFEAFDRNRHKIKYSTVKRFVTDMNKFISSNYKLAGESELTTYAFLKIQKMLKYDSLSSVLINDMVFHINEIDQDDQLDIKLIKYDYSEINNLIISRAKPVEDNRTKLIGEALYNNYIYQLFVVEFINYLDKERNQSIRSQLIKLVTETNFKKDTTKFRTTAKEILKDYPNDIKAFNDQVTDVYLHRVTKAMLIDSMNERVYEFDRITLNKLIKLDMDELKAELKKISGTFSVQKDLDVTAIKFPNIYMPCDSIMDKTGYCEKSKLIINRDIDVLIDILASDLKDSLRARNLLENTFADIIVSPFSFSQWPTEIVTIYRLTI